MAASPTTLATASFTVSPRDLDDQFALSICRLLQAVTEQTDAALIRATGALDWSNIHISQYHLDVVGSARLGDTVLIHTFIRSDDAQGLALELRAVRKRARRETPLLNGHFVFTDRRNALIERPLAAADPVCCVQCTVKA